MADNTRISPYNLTDCMTTTDDALQNYMSSIGFKQSFDTNEIKLVIGYSSVVMAGATFILDYKFGWEETKHFTLLTVVIYFLLNSLYTYWIYFVEKDIVFEGRYGGHDLIVSTSVKQLKPYYHLEFKSRSDKSTKKWTVKSASAPFMKWFTEDGYFVAGPFQKWLVANFPLVKEADPKNAEDVGTVSDSDKNNTHRRSSSKKRKH